MVTIERIWRRVEDSAMVLRRREGVEIAIMFLASKFDLNEFLLLALESDPFSYVSGGVSGPAYKCQEADFDK
jgi:hypothetical protein